MVVHLDAFCTTSLAQPEGWILCFMLCSALASNADNIQFLFIDEITWEERLLVQGHTVKRREEMEFGPKSLPQSPVPPSAPFRLCMGWIRLPPGRYLSHRAFKDALGCSQPRGGGKGTAAVISVWCPLGSPGGWLMQLPALCQARGSNSLT